MFKGLGVAVLVCILGACGAPKPRPNSPTLPAAIPVPSTIPPAGAHIYRIDAAQSELRVLVYRAGPLARLGHNHVMVNRSLQGSVNLERSPTGSSFSLSVPVADFMVDDARARAEEGSDFPGEIPDDAKAGTLRNMLGAALLDGVQYPYLTADSKAVEGANGEFIATVAIRVAGHESTIEVPFTLSSGMGSLTASGSMQLRQTSLGLTPYSLMRGALQVQDTVRLKFKIVAVAG